MKFKKNLTIAILALLTSSSIFAEESIIPVNAAKAFCADMYVYQNESMPIHTVNYWNVKNDTSVEQHAQVMYQLCLPNQPCIKKITPDVALEPNKVHVSEIDGVYDHVKISKKGTYFYKVITDVGGFMILHDEMTCKLIVIE